MKLTIYYGHEHWQELTDIADPDALIKRIEKAMKNEGFITFAGQNETTIVNLTQVKHFTFKKEE